MTRALATAALWCALAAACGGSLAGGGASTAPDPLVGVPADELYARGIRYKEAGDLIRAEQYLAAAVDRGYPEKDALETLLEVCVAGSRYQAGLSHAERYLARHPEDWALRYLAASLRIAIGDAATARVELERVIGDRPQLADAHFDLAVVLRDELRDPNGAEAAFRRYLELAPNGDRATAARTWLSWRDRERREPGTVHTVPDNTSAADPPVAAPREDAP